MAGKQVNNLAGRISDRGRWPEKEWQKIGISVPALVLIQVAPNLSPTIFELGTPFKVQTWPYGYCLACPSRVLDYIDMRGRPGPVMVFIGPGLLVLKQDGSNSYVECTGKSHRAGKEKSNKL